GARPPESRRPALPACARSRSPEPSPRSTSEAPTSPSAPSGACQSPYRLASHVWRSARPLQTCREAYDDIAPLAERERLVTTEKIAITRVRRVQHTDVERERPSDQLTSQTSREVDACVSSGRQAPPLPRRDPRREATHALSGYTDTRRASRSRRHLDPQRRPCSP